jgi:hypothetical protein
MRAVLSGLIIVGLSVVTPASALHRTTYYQTSYRYSGCVCHFGYGGDFCNEEVSCGSEGGHCTDYCKLPTRGYHSALGY